MELPLQQKKFMHEDEEIDNGTPVKYLPLRDLYSATAPCISASGSSNVMSKKVKARKLHEPPFDSDLENSHKKPSSLRVYQRRPNKIPRVCSFFDSLVEGLKADDSRNRGELHAETERRKSCNNDGAELNSGECLDVKREDVAVEINGEDVAERSLDSNTIGKGVSKKRKKRSGYELLRLGIDSRSLCESAGKSSREGRTHNNVSSSPVTKCVELKGSRRSSEQKVASGLALVKRWVELSFKDANPEAFVGLTCKVYWPLDEQWYSGQVTEYNSETLKHDIKYRDGDVESLILSGEKIKFYVSRQEIRSLNLKCSVPTMELKGLDFDEMLVLAAAFDDSSEIEPGDILWAKLTGHAMWPAVVIDEAHVDACRRLKAITGERSVPVQFFGTHDFARIRLKQAEPFLKGLLSFYHLKCKQRRFGRSLEEAKMYLKEHKLPNRMLRLQNGIDADDYGSASGEDEEESDSSKDSVGGEGLQKGNRSCPFEIEDLCVINLGKIVRDSEFFHDKKYIWPEGYTAIRKYISITDPSVSTSYKMEVLRNPQSKAWPLFRVTLDNGDQIDGSTPDACWKKIDKMINEAENKLPNGYPITVEEKNRFMFNKPGSYMFGFSIQEVSKLIEALPYHGLCSKSMHRKLAYESYLDKPAGYRPVRVDWKDLDKCNVCHMDEEYEDNLFLQCDKCRMMVHARCYGELEPLDGVVWLCNLCGPEAPRRPPPCCLCPVIGGAMKPTTDGRWAHLTCAMWIPETCLLDVKRMEPIDGLDRINKDRWKLLCSICGVSYGACIQCSSSTCRVAYHPLCARAAGLCVELEDESRLLLMSVNEDDDQCIRLLSFCKKHRQPSSERSPADRQIWPSARNCSNYKPPANPSGSARTEPYDFFGRRGRKEPEALAAASVKRLFVENRPYLVSGYRQNGFLGNAPSCNELVLTSVASSLQKSKLLVSDTSSNILSMAEKYKCMKATFRKRLAFGKSGIHGFGIFAKHAHRAGDMVIEYTGELVRPPISDLREHFIYNSLVGAGTYMFRIDDERVIDATRAGSIAHLINHSCEPNCYSRAINVNGDQHIIIFAKRDINQWEELTYDYRFFSIDEQLACYCGFPQCRGVVNDIEAEERAAKLLVSRRELIDWKGE